MSPEREDVDGVVPTKDARKSDPTFAERKLTWWQWAFLSRRTGRVSIVSWPNIPLWIWIATAVERRVPFVHGRAGTALALAGSVALVVWGIGELWRGVNPWRRVLGFAVLVGMVLSATR